MAQPVAGAVVAIFGTESPILGCSCEYHSICGHCVDLDSLIRFKMTTVEEGKCIYSSLHFLIILSSPPFNSSANNTYRTIIGAFW